jgi:hypothetical protein
MPEKSNKNFLKSLKIREKADFSKAPQKGLVSYNANRNSK